jgi:hypothetical protein
MIFQGHTENGRIGFELKTVSPKFMLFFHKKPVLGL